MSTGFQKVSQTDRTIYSADRVTERQNDSMTIWQNSRAAKPKEPALVFQLFSLVINTKVVQNVNRMSEKQKDRPRTTPLGPLTHPQPIDQ